ncbi:MAG: hypothetical protein K8S14_03870 [Actinomycetia bacterium]|nr:hypothetical protein [Actinomycetes bacterium]
MGIGNSVSHVNETIDELSESVPMATGHDIDSTFKDDESTLHIKDNTIIANPSAALGRVLYKKDDKDSFIEHWIPVPFVEDSKSVLKSPITLSELIIDNKLCGEGAFLYFISLNLSREEVCELRTVLNYTCVAKTGNEYVTALKEWLNDSSNQSLTEDPKIDAITIVTGVAQKYVTSKRYRKFTGGAKGSGWGVNVGGELYLSSSEFKLDIVYELKVVTIPKTLSRQQFLKAAEKPGMMKQLEIEQRNRLLRSYIMDGSISKLASSSK